MEGMTEEVAEELRKGAEAGRAFMLNMVSFAEQTTLVLVNVRKVFDEKKLKALRNDPEIAPYFNAIDNQLHRMQYEYKTMRNCIPPVEAEESIEPAYASDPGEG